MKTKNFFMLFKFLCDFQIVVQNYIFLRAYMCKKKPNKDKNKKIGHRNTILAIFFAFLTNFYYLCGAFGNLCYRMSLGDIKSTNT